MVRYFRTEESQESVLVIPVGNVTAETELTYEYGARARSRSKKTVTAPVGASPAPKLSPAAGASPAPKMLAVPTLTLEGKPHLPFQLQIEYTGKDGSRCMRVISEAKPVTRDRDEAERGDGREGEVEGRGQGQERGREGEGGEEGSGTGMRHRERWDILKRVTNHKCALYDNLELNTEHCNRIHTSFLPSPSPPYRHPHGRSGLPRGPQDGQAGHGGRVHDCSTQRLLLSATSPALQVWIWVCQRTKGPGHGLQCITIWA